MKHAAKLLALLSFSASAFAQVNCATLELAWIASEKTIAMERLGYLGDNSAPRETARMVRAGQEVTAQLANAILMQQLKCPLPPSPAGDHQRFSKAAIDCGIERMGWRGSETPPKCKSADWVPAGGVK